MAATYIVFLAEDNPGDVALLKLALKTHAVPCTLNIHCDGAGALSAIASAETAAQHERPHLFVLDLNLGRVSGIALLKRLRESSVFKDTPVVVWTTSDEPSDRQRSSEFGADRHICKPAHLDEFMQLGAVIGEMLHAVEVTGCLQRH